MKSETPLKNMETRKNFVRNVASLGLFLFTVLGVLVGAEWLPRNALVQFIAFSMLAMFYVAGTVFVLLERNPASITKPLRKNRIGVKHRVSQ